MEKLIGATIIGALTGVLLSIILIPFSVHQAEWFLALGTVVSLFVGLLLMHEEERFDGHSEGNPPVPTYPPGKASPTPNSRSVDHAGPVDTEGATEKRECEERQRVAVGRLQDSLVTVAQNPAFKKAIASAIVGTFLIMPFAILLLLMGINKLLWWISAGAVIGAFIGLLIAAEDEQPQLPGAAHETAKVQD